MIGLGWGWDMATGWYLAPKGSNAGIPTGLPTKMGT